MPLRIVNNSILFLFIHSLVLTRAEFALAVTPARTPAQAPPPAKPSPAAAVPKKQSPDKPTAEKVKDSVETKEQTAADFVKPSSTGSSGSKNKATDYVGDAEFQSKIKEMSLRIGKSLTLIREQILKNQSAPFLSDLYLQLGDLLSTKAMILYFQKMEADKGMSLQMTEVDKSSPIVEAQLEAIATYKKILKEFPKFDKKDQVLYRMSVSLKSIGEGPAFLVTSEELIKEFPKSKEAMRARIAMGQHYYDEGSSKDVLKILEPAKDYPFPYERNLARYRIGLTYITMERFVDALKIFETVATDDELKEADVLSEVSLQNPTAPLNVKREALIDSVRAFTEVYKKDADPIAFYSRVAPTESLFQETIEKLAYRYIFLKKEKDALILLRTLCERIVDPQKVLNIYQEVLLLIPPQNRLEIPFSEIKYVIDKFVQWKNFLEMKPEVWTSSFKFFETQIRELGTRSHDVAKSEVVITKKHLLFERAKDYYLLYIGLFPNGPSKVKIAIDLADVYYQQKKYLEAGDYYLRIYLGEFGKATTAETLLQNGIHCFLTKATYDYYEQIRIKGLLLKAISAYMAFKPEKKKDPQMNFVVAKTTYEQGLYDQALQDLLRIMKEFPAATKEVEASSELILDYYNTRSDFAGLSTWTAKMLAIKTLPEPLRKRISSINSNALSKKIDESVKKKEDYDPFAQGKLYLQTALDNADESVRSVALEKALEKSRSEKDITTFLRAANAMATAEKNPEKRSSILRSMADECIGISMFQTAKAILQKVYSDNSLPQSSRKSAFEKYVRVIIMMKDFREASLVMSSSMWPGVTDSSRQMTRQVLFDAYDAPINADLSALSRIPASQMSSEELSVLSKHIYRLPKNWAGDVLAELSRKCAKAGGAPCGWRQMFTLIPQFQRWNSELATAPTTIAMIEPQAVKFNAIQQNAQKLQASGDPSLDATANLISSRAFTAFSQFLLKAAQVNKNIEKPLIVKAQDSTNTAKILNAKCKEILESASVASPILNYCLSNIPLKIPDLVEWPRKVNFNLPRDDPKEPKIKDGIKVVFVDRKKPGGYLDLAESYYNSRHYHHAAATASYGMSAFAEAKDDFSTLYGCSLIEMGLLSEALFNLKGASDYKGLRAVCLRNLGKYGATAAR
jgi:tetratricopeptide (TPR) repeat protein